jgi:hypothetical protein
MRIVVFFAENFCAWPIALLGHMQKQRPDLEIIGFAVDQDIYNKVAAAKNLNVIKLYNLDALEKEWISGKASADDIAAIEKIYGAETIVKTIVADKNLASGWIDGAILYDTPLTTKARNAENLKAYIHGFYRFLEKFYREYQPDLTFLYTIASGATYAIAAASQHHGCPFVRFQHSRIDKYFILDSTLEGYLAPVKELYYFDAVQVGAQAKNYLADYRAIAEKDTSNLALNKKMYTSAMQWKTIARAAAGICWRSLKQFILKRDIPLRARPERLNFVFKVSSALRRRYKSATPYVQNFKDHESSDYIYFALHVDPEASTLIAAPFQANQTTIIEVLSKAIPLSSKLVIKEHPIMIGKRPRGFYKKIAEMPNVVLIDPDTNSREVIEKSSAVATITGTVGLEALLLRKKVILMAETPYMMIGEGFVHCRDLNGLSQDIAHVKEMKPASDAALEKYIAAIMQAGFYMPDELLWKYSPKVFEDNMDLMNALSSYLLRYTKSQNVENSKIARIS